MRTDKSINLIRGPRVIGYIQPDEDRFKKITVTFGITMAIIAVVLFG